MTNLRLKLISLVHINHKNNSHPPLTLFHNGCSITFPTDAQLVTWVYGWNIARVSRMATVSEIQQNILGISKYNKRCFMFGTTVNVHCHSQSPR